MVGHERHTRDWCALFDHTRASIGAIDRLVGPASLRPDGSAQSWWSCPLLTVRDQFALDGDSCSSAVGCVPSHRPYAPRVRQDGHITTRAHHPSCCSDRAALLQSQVPSAGPQAYDGRPARIPTAGIVLGLDACARVRGGCGESVRWEAIMRQSRTCTWHS